MKGQTGDFRFILSFMIFTSVVILLGGLALTSGFDTTIFTGFNIPVFVTSLIGVAGACVLVTGIPCAAALLFFNLITFMTSGNAVIFSLVLTPLLVTLAFIIAKLGRGVG